MKKKKQEIVMNDGKINNGVQNPEISSSKDDRILDVAQNYVVKWFIVQLFLFCFNIPS